MGWIEVGATCHLTFRCSTCGEQKESVGDEPQPQVRLWEKVVIGPFCEGCWRKVEREISAAHLG